VGSLMLSWFGEGVGLELQEGSAGERDGVIS
jgi:hypothetical protein